MNSNNPIASAWGTIIAIGVGIVALIVLVFFAGSAFAQDVVELPETGNDLLDSIITLSGPAITAAIGAGLAYLGAAFHRTYGKVVKIIKGTATEWDDTLLKMVEDRFEDRMRKLLDEREAQRKAEEEAARKAEEERRAAVATAAL